MSSRIKDITEFCKLFRVRIPIESEFDYYIETLASSNEYAWVAEKVDNFVKLEESLGDESVGSFKMEQLFRMKNVIANTRSYEDFTYTNYQVRSFRKDNLAEHNNRFLLSVDIKQANYAILKSFDIYNEFPENWSELCKEENMDPLISSSKAWRQLVFGKLTPKKNQRFQHLFIQAFIDLLRPLGLTDSHLISISSDEATLIIGEDEKEAAQNMQAVQLIANMVAGPDCSERVPEPFNGRLSLNCNPFRLTTLGKGAYIRHKYKLEEGELVLSHKSLYGVPGSQYYMNFKKHVLEQDFEERDLLFMNEHKLAKWVID